MGPRSVLCRNNCVDSGESPGLLGIDPFDLGVRPRAEDDLSVKHVGKDQIIAIDSLACDLFTRVHARDGFANDCEFGHLESSSFVLCLGRSSLPDFSGRILNGLDNLSVAGATTEIPG